MGGLHMHRAAGRGLTQGRDRSLDLFRAVATVRVVIYHATSDQAWTWFAAIPAMFFVGGALYAGSLDRRPHVDVLRSRLRRLLVPAWAWAAFVAVVYTVDGAWSRVPWWGAVGFVVPIVPAAGAGARSGLEGAIATADPLYWTYMGLWYLTAYLWFTLVGIPLRGLMRRFPLATIAVLAAPVMVSGAVGVAEIGAISCNLLLWALGYAYHDRRDDLPSQGTFLAVGAVAAALGLALVAAEPAGLRLSLEASPLVLDALGVALICVFLGFRSSFRRVADARLVTPAVRWISTRSLTIFLWHPLAIAIAEHLHADRATAASPSWGSGWAGGALAITETLGITFVLTCAVGWIEDVAAGRPPSVLSRRAASAAAGESEDGVDVVARDVIDVPLGERSDRQ